MKTSPIFLFMLIMASLVTLLCKNSDASICVFDPFQRHYEQLRNDLQQITGEPVIKTTSLDESLLQHKTWFLLLLKLSNQGVARQDAQDNFILSKHEQELIIRHLDNNGQVHLFSQQFFKAPDMSADNPLYAQRLKIIYSGALAVQYAADTVGGVPQTFTNNIQPYRLVRKDPAWPAISFPATPVIIADSAVPVMKTISASSGGHMPTSYAFPIPKGRIVIDLFYLLDYPVYLQAVCTYYGISGTAIAHSNNVGGKEAKSRFLIGQNGTSVSINHGSFQNRFSTSAILYTLQGRRCPQYHDCTQGFSKLPAGVYILK